MTLHRLLCWADTHGLGPAMDRAGEPDILLHAGDVYAGAWLFNDTEADEFAEVRDWRKELRDRHGDKRFYAVRGNHDIADPCGVFSGGADASGRLIRLGEGLWLAGVGWHGERYYENPLETDLLEVLDSLRQPIAREVRRGDKLILLTHYPLYCPEFGDDPSGSYQCIRDWVEELSPALVIQGHNHEWQGRSAKIQTPNGLTRVICPDPTGQLIDLPDRQP